MHSFFHDLIPGGLVDTSLLIIRFFFVIKPMVTYLFVIALQIK